MNAFCNIPLARHAWLVETMRMLQGGLVSAEQGDRFNAVHALMTLGFAVIDGPEAARVYRLSTAGEVELRRIEAGEAAFALWLEHGDTCALREGGAAGALALCDALDAGAGRDIDWRCARLLLRQYAEQDADLRAPQTKLAPAIRIDTREQDPLTPVAYTGRWEQCPSVRETIPSCDYDLYDRTDCNGVAHFSPFLAERKSAADLYGSLQAGLERLRSSFLRAITEDKAARICILVECSETMFWDYVAAMSTSKDGMVNQSILAVKVKKLTGAMRSLWLDYGVAIIWTGSREGSEQWIGWVAQRATKMLTSKKDRKKYFERGLDKVAPWMVRGKDE